jgi:hypothetical protein
MIAKMYHHVLLTSLFVATIFSAPFATPSWAQDSSAARLKEMTELARGLTLSGPDGKTLEPRPAPMVRYDDQPRYIEDATLWALGGKGRPAGVLKVELYPQGRALYGLVSLADAKITAKSTDGWSWTSGQPGLKMQAVPKAPAPLGTERGRLLQMGELARRFSGYELESVRGRMQMRLVSKPVLRYSDADAGIQDGAIYSLAMGTNPDVLLIIESRKVAGSETPVWHYGLARLGGAELSVSLDGKEVWTLPTVTIPHVGETYTNRFLPRLKDSR